MNKSDKSLSVTDETNNTTVVKKRGRKKLDESAVAAQELPVKTLSPVQLELSYWNLGSQTSLHSENFLRLPE